LNSIVGFSDYTIDGTPLRDNDGNILYYIGLSIEITDMIEVQNNLLREKEEAQKADRLKSSFIANMSHEIRTPLNSIVGFSDYLQYVTDEKERKQFIDIIKSNNERLLSIIGDILDFSQIESGTMKITVGPVEINPILHDIYESFSHQLAGSKVEVMIDPHDDDCTVQCDALRLSQVINNFMSNAAKYTSEGHIRIGYTEENNGVKIFVEDTGKGIPADQKDKVFDRFEKLNSFVPGTGLGLSICRDITKMFHGKIGVESEEGKGSTFWIWIPKKSPAE
jgi:signal transduction histidine kinase